jgi:hypothetical protein
LHRAVRLEQGGAGRGIALSGGDCRLARIAVDRGAAWSAAMERYAPLAPSGYPTEKMEEHLRAQIVAGAIANGSGAISAEQGDDVIAYLHGWRDVDRARGALPA